ncbi:MAG: hypothetical protein V4733_02730 [Verrucomicrobiota bacterium]
MKMVLIMILLASHALGGAYNIDVSFSEGIIKKIPLFSKEPTQKIRASIVSGKKEDTWGLIEKDSRVLTAKPDAYNIYIYIKLISEENDRLMIDVYFSGYQEGYPPLFITERMDVPVGIEVRSKSGIKIKANRVQM